MIGKYHLPIWDPWLARNEHNHFEFNSQIFIRFYLFEHINTYYWISRSANRNLYQIWTHIKSAKHKPLNNISFFFFYKSSLIAKFEFGLYINWSEISWPKPTHLVNWAENHKSDSICKFTYFGLSLDQVSRLRQLLTGIIVVLNLL